jgi:hypothetical protein
MLRYTKVLMALSTAKQGCSPRTKALIASVASRICCWDKSSSISLTRANCRFSSAIRRSFAHMAFRTSDGQSQSVLWSSELVAPHPMMLSSPGRDAFNVSAHDPPSTRHRLPLCAPPLFWCPKNDTKLVMHKTHRLFGWRCPLHAAQPDRPAELLRSFHCIEGWPSRLMGPSRSPLLAALRCCQQFDECIQGCDATPEHAAWLATSAAHPGMLAHHDHAHLRCQSNSKLRHSATRFGLLCPCW